MLMDKVIGHRGVAAEAPENTLAGLRLAVDKGFAWVEVDVTLLGGGTAVLFHDRRLHRTTNQQGSVRSVDASMLEHADAGSWFSAEYKGEKIPTLTEALIELKKLNVNLNIELKINGCSKRKLVNTLLQTLEETAFPKEKLVVSSFNHSALTFFAKQTDIATACLFERLPVNWRKKAEAVGAKAINLYEKKVTRRKVEQVKAAGYDVYCYTVNSRRRFEQLLALGVDGVFTDHSFLLEEQ